MWTGKSLKQNCWKRTVWHTSIAMANNGRVLENPSKALYRRGIARMHLRNWPACLHDLKCAIKADPKETHEISFTISDDAENERIGRMLLKINVADLVPPDRFEVSLNGVSIEPEPCRRIPRWHDAFTGVWMEFELNKVRPHRGPNSLQIALRERPEGFEGEISIDDVEIIVEYDLLAAS